MLPSFRPQAPTSNLNLQYKFAVLLCKGLASAMGRDSAAYLLLCTARGVQLAHTCADTIL